MQFTSTPCSLTSPSIVTCYSVERAPSFSYCIRLPDWPIHINKRGMSGEERLAQISPPISCQLGRKSMVELFVCSSGRHVTNGEDALLSASCLTTIGCCLLRLNTNDHPCQRRCVNYSTQLLTDSTSPSLAHPFPPINTPTSLIC